MVDRSKNRSKGRALSMGEEIRSFVEKPLFSDSAAALLFQKQNPQVPATMSPK